MRALEEERQVGKIERRSMRLRRAGVSDKSRKTDPATGLSKWATRHAKVTGTVAAERLQLCKTYLYFPHDFSILLVILVEDTAPLCRGL